MTLPSIKMLPILLAVFCFVGSAWGNGEFVVFHAPPSIKFLTESESKPLPADLVPDIVSASLGYSTSSDSSWSGLVRVSPFNSARLAVILSLDGPSARLPGEVAKHALKIARYPLKPVPGQSSNVWWMEIKHAARQRDMLNASATLITLDKKPKSTETDGLELGSLDAKLEEDRAWMREMQSIREIIQQASAGEFCSASSGPSVLWLESTALHALSDLHGAGSTQAQDASKMLGSALAGLNEELQSVCQGKVLVAAVTSDASHTRRTRSLLATDPKAEIKGDHNLSKAYDKNYPVMFSIFLIFGIGFFFSLLAISIAIATMDPGRDSIIYRMTNTRMKKDN